MRGIQYCPAEPVTLISYFSHVSASWTHLLSDFSRLKLFRCQEFEDNESDADLNLAEGWKHDTEQPEILARPWISGECQMAQRLPMRPQEFDNTVPDRPTFRMSGKLFKSEGAEKFQSVVAQPATPKHEDLGNGPTMMCLSGNVETGSQVPGEKSQWFLPKSRRNQEERRRIWKLLYTVNLRPRKGGNQIRGSFHPYRLGGVSILQARAFWIHQNDTVWIEKGESLTQSFRAIRRPDCQREEDVGCSAQI
ncbi:hypothetical protein B0H19DRAFT_1349597 [Mycena capillaripes]|nr:hypothetical protein B0H19DRAFT_1349597 [Mycena capillaripes]